MMICDQHTGQLTLTYDLAAPRPNWYPPFEASWEGGDTICVTGDLLRGLDYDHPQIHFDPPLLKIAQYTLRWVEWHEELDMAVFERVCET